MFMKKGSYLFLATSMLASTVVTTIPPSTTIVAKAVEKQSAEQLNNTLAEQMPSILQRISELKSEDVSPINTSYVTDRQSIDEFVSQFDLLTKSEQLNVPNYDQLAQANHRLFELERGKMFDVATKIINLNLPKIDETDFLSIVWSDKWKENVQKATDLAKEIPENQQSDFNQVRMLTNDPGLGENLQRLQKFATSTSVDWLADTDKFGEKVNSNSLTLYEKALAVRQRDKMPTFETELNALTVTIATYIDEKAIEGGLENYSNSDQNKAYIGLNYKTYPLYERLKFLSESINVESISDEALKEKMKNFKNNINKSLDPYTQSLRTQGYPPYGELPTTFFKLQTFIKKDSRFIQWSAADLNKVRQYITEKSDFLDMIEDYPILAGENPLPEWEGLTFTSATAKNVSSYVTSLAEYVKIVNALPLSKNYPQLTSEEKQEVRANILRADQLYEKLRNTENENTLIELFNQATKDETFVLNSLRNTILTEQKKTLTEQTEVNLLTNRVEIEQTYALYQNALTYGDYKESLQDESYATVLNTLKNNVSQQKVQQVQDKMKQIDLTWTMGNANDDQISEAMAAYEILDEQDVKQLNDAAKDTYEWIVDFLAAKVIYEKIGNLTTPLGTSKNSDVQNMRKDVGNLTERQREFLTNIKNLENAESYLQPLVAFETALKNLPTKFTNFKNYENKRESYKDLYATYTSFSSEQTGSLSTASITKMGNLIESSKKYDYEAVDAKIEALTTQEITESYKKVVREARAAYDALDSGAQEKVQKLATLIAVEEAISVDAISKVKEAIAQLPNVSEVTEEKFEEVQKQATAVRNLVEQLTAKEKEAVENMQRLLDLETFLLDKTLLQIQNDIEALPTIEAVQIQHIEAITTVAKKFDALTATQQRIITNKDKLEQLKSVLSALNKANDFVTRVNELPTEEALTVKDAEQLTESLQLFSELDTQTKSYVPEATQKQLIRLHVQYVQQLIEALPAKEEVHLTSEGHIQDVRAAYEAIKNYEDISTVQLTKLVEAEDMIVDLKAAENVQQQITALPAIEQLTISDEANVQKVRKAYDALTASQQQLVLKNADLSKWEAQLMKLQAAIQAVDAQIAALPTVANVQLTDEAAVKAARQAYDALATDAKARVSNETVLKAVEAQLDKLIAAEAANTKAVREVTAFITTLPAASHITLSHQTLIQTAYDAFVALSAEEQKNVANAFDLMVAKALVDDLAEADVRKKALDVMTKIAALPAVGLVDVTDESAYTQAQFAYDLLTDTEKKAVTNAALLPEVAAQLDVLKEAATAVKTMITNLPLASQVSEANREAIEKARRAYESLTVAQKKIVTNSSTLDALEAKLADNQTARVKQVVETIQRLPLTITTSEEKAISNARAMYDALTVSNQNLVTNYATLLNAETQLEALMQADKEAALKVETLLYELPFTVTASDTATVTKARKAYNQLTVAQRLYVTNTVLLEQAEAALVALAEKDVATAKKVVTAIDALPTKAKLKLTNATALKSARTKYSALTTTQKQYVDNYDTLVQLETQMALLQKRDKALKAKDIEIDIPTVKNTTKVIEGYVTPKAKVVVYKGTTKLKAATVDSKGFYKVTIPAQKAKTVLSFVIYNELGDRLVTKKVTVKAATVKAATAVKATTQKVTGKATKNTSISIYKGTKKIRTTKVTTKGTFSVAIPKQKKGTVLKIVVVDTAGNTSTNKSAKVR